MQTRLNLTKSLRMATLLALLCASGFLAASFSHAEEIPRAVYFGAFAFALTVASLLLVISKTTDALRAARERLDLALEISNDGWWDWNVQTDEMVFSEQWCKAFGFSPNEVSENCRFRDMLVHPEDCAAVSEHYQNHLTGASPSVQIEHRMRTREGGTKWTLNRAKAVSRDARTGQATRVIGVDVDITKMHELAEQVRFQESHDTLTGLFNRHSFERWVETVLEAPELAGLEHSVLMVDVDRLGFVNETCGHIAGDDLLKRVARLLRSQARQRDTIARLGGDEFGLFLEGCGLDPAERLARSVVGAVESLRFRWEGKEFPVSACVGIALVTGAPGDAAEVLKTMDAACSVAKNKGRGAVHRSSGDDLEIAHRRGTLRWISDITTAIDEDRFELYAQTIAPSTNTGGKALLHYELLLRLRDDEGKFIPPGVFIPAAELYGLGPKIDRWVVARALQTLSDNPDHVADLGLCSINLSGTSIGGDDFRTFVAQQLDMAKVTEDKICFEITETAAIANRELVCDFIAEMRGRGCKFALDDFGSGLSSFAYLKNLPVDLLKIDGMFIRDMLEDDTHLAMVRSINEIGQVMGKETVAEFVENQAIRDRLAAMGVNFVQGYGIGRPQPLSDYMRYGGVQSAADRVT